jgi:hypothetical protein
MCLWVVEAPYITSDRFLRRFLYVLREQGGAWGGASCPERGRSGCALSGNF